MYMKFVKNKPKGYWFIFNKDVRKFLDDWGFVSRGDNKHLFAQIGTLLANLRDAEILEKPSHAKKWVVTGKRLVDKIDET